MLSKLISLSKLRVIEALYPNLVKVTDCSNSGLILFNFGEHNDGFLINPKNLFPLGESSYS